VVAQSHAIHTDKSQKLSSMVFLQTCLLKMSHRINVAAPAFKKDRINCQFSAISLTTYFLYFRRDRLAVKYSTLAPFIIFYTKINKSYFPQLLQEAVHSLMYLLNYLASLMFSTHLICVYKCEYLCVCLSLSLPICMPVCLSTYPRIYLSMY